MGHSITLPSSWDLNLRSISSLSVGMTQDEVSTISSDMERRSVIVEEIFPITFLVALLILSWRLLCLQTSLPSWRFIRKSALSIDPSRNSPPNDDDASWDQLLHCTRAIQASIYLFSVRVLMLFISIAYPFCFSKRRLVLALYVTVTTHHSTNFISKGKRVKPGLHPFRHGQNLIVAIPTSLLTHQVRTLWGCLPYKYFTIVNACCCWFPRWDINHRFIRWSWICFSYILLRWSTNSWNVSGTLECASRRSPSKLLTIFSLPLRLMGLDPRMSLSLTTIPSSKMFEREWRLICSRVSRSRRASMVLGSRTNRVCSMVQRRISSWFSWCVVATGASLFSMMCCIVYCCDSWGSHIWKPLLQSVPYGEHARYECLITSNSEVLKCVRGNARAYITMKLIAGGRAIS